MSQESFEYHIQSTTLTQIYEDVAVNDREGDKIGTVKNMY